MEKKLNLIEERFNELNEQLLDPSIASDPERFKVLNKERSSIEETVSLYHDYKRILKDIEDTKAMIRGEEDAELCEYMNQELEGLAAQEEQTKERLYIMLLPKD
ncbi:MAG: PCRF domain-containing protein, partial [bacterium]|nr:PCRF domain-containing protein [bacterium]